MKHTPTPGPWEIEEFSDGALEINTSNQVICELSGHFEDDEHTYPNARLIAAAPDLLEACKEASRIYDHFSMSSLGAAVKYGPDYVPLTDEEYLEMRLMLEQAVAKAEGGLP